MWTESAKRANDVDFSSKKGIDQDQMPLNLDACVSLVRNMQHIGHASFL